MSNTTSIAMPHDPQPPTAATPSTISTSSAIAPPHTGPSVLHSRSIKHQWSGAASLLNPLPADDVRSGSETVETAVSVVQADAHSAGSIEAVAAARSLEAQEVAQAVESVDAETVDINGESYGPDEQDSSSSSPSNSTNFLLGAKNAHRTKLTTHDIRLILYFIVQIKPFKYVGDRSLSQTKKWELIQQKFASHKHSDHEKDRKNDDSPVVVPTVRTLQRQLATAIRKASIRRHERKQAGIIDSSPSRSQDDEYYLFKHISADSSLTELEAALLDLNDLSDKLKTGKLANTSHLFQGSMDTEVQRGVTNLTSMTSSLRALIDSTNSANGAIDTRLTSTLRELSDIKDDIGALYANDRYSYSSISQSMQAFDDFLAKSADFQSQVINENHSLFLELDKLIKNHYDKLEAINKNYADYRDEVSEKIVSLLADKIQHSTEVKKDVQDRILSKLTSLRDTVRR
ncbi:predicted protein [Scheffersomyces stipitis CBS 6054]|uniref:Uncharacterized protein n=1 Tax=Scheffersomyces stipitis (strain ATCC 58785 / CBS 6054 / NBRC 10063 / NRRL Y-11545) TaxID=322104 RepID=A3LZE0_PICST|nr:predicted protein [Scheffersomyces stipitis CBS 6054]ABN68322.2 predicted protein [Scheffersomyces stipitis CBS 6054]KAG2734373.1 hypothetical protein G9P44_002379 [Scheffersomyces stipitis]